MEIADSRAALPDLVQILAETSAGATETMTGETTLASVRAAGLETSTEAIATTIPALDSSRASALVEMTAFAGMRIPHLSNA